MSDDLTMPEDALLDDLADEPTDEPLTCWNHRRRPS